LKALESYLENRNTTVQTFNAKLIAILKHFGVDVSGLDLGPTDVAIGKTRVEQANEPGARIEMGPGLALGEYTAQVGPVTIPKGRLGFQHGGQVPRFIDSRDTVLAGFRPGKRVISEEQQAWLERVGGGGPTFNFAGANFSFMGAPNRATVEAWAREMHDALERLGPGMRAPR
jgi:hypothetical protein